MPSQELNIDSIVKAVVARLRELAPSAAPVDATTTETNQTSNHHRIDSSPVTLVDLRKELGRDWSQVKVLEVPTGAVVTPAVKDELRAAGIELQQFRAPASRTDVSQDSFRSWLVAETDFAKRLAQRSDISGWKCQAFPDLLAATQRVGRHVKESPKHRVVWHTPKPFAATLVSQEAGKSRCVQLHHPDQLPAAMAQATPNIIILDANLWEEQAVVQLLKRWCE
ncbi:MAG TPA: hypothetical protein DDW52_18670 [Planctomycetaceae bacterium]|nr:hypothetical protein [Planctomycetaceae bacterium]